MKVIDHCAFDAQKELLPNHGQIKLNSPRNYSPNLLTKNQHNDKISIF